MSDNPELQGRPTLLSLDFSRAQAFLHACMTSNPRVTYGFGEKVPFPNAVPGRDFTQIDCSGFVCEAIRRAANTALGFPDGSIRQLQWVQQHRFEKSTIAAGMQDDGIMRIAFPDAPNDFSHVVLIIAGKTLQSREGVGPDSLRWDGTGWQAKASVFNLARDV